MSNEPVNSNEATKKCPFCAEIIKAEALKCRYCGSDLTVNQQSPPEQNAANIPKNNSESKQSSQINQDKTMPLYSSFSFTIPYAVAFICGIVFCFVYGNAISYANVSESLQYCSEKLEKYGWLVFITTILTGIFSLILLYRCWDVVQDGEYATTTPLKAVVFMFIPVFNLFWFYFALSKLCNDLNDYMDRYKLKIIPCNSRLVRVALIVWLGGVVMLLLVNGLPHIGDNTIIEIALYFLILLSLAGPLLLSFHSTYNFFWCWFVAPWSLISIVLMMLAGYSLMRTARDIQAFKMEQMNLTKNR